ncbi:MAG: tyrosine-type recombinase/integrase [Candidatus Marinimicrobia bacterium]|nr:tyrosine-type recombinase/integrase [Candidatus Neomarinimicrobiota bacterium]
MIKEELIKSNPARLVTLPQIVKVREHRLLDDVDIEVIFKSAGIWQLYYAYLLHTGLRAGDVAMLTYENINRKKKTIINYIRKSRRMHEIPLSDTLIQLTPDHRAKAPLFPSLYAVNENSDGKIVTNEKRLHDRLSKPRKYMQAILQAAERLKADLHSFRVTYNNQLRDLGLSDNDRQILMTHSSSRTTQIYTHPNMDLMREYINKLPDPTKNVSKT